MTKKSPSRWGLLWWFLAIMAMVILQGFMRFHGNWNILLLYAGGAAGFIAVYLLVKIAIAIRDRRLWIEDRRARGLKTYEQPRDAISDFPIVRHILFLPKPPQP